MRIQKKTIKTYLFSVCIIVFAGITFTACKNSNGVFENGTSQHTKAQFDYFSYKGQDTYYKENPLPGDDYFYNPILPGWNSDPSICSNGKDYFLVTSTFVYFPGVPIFHSTDLVNWKQIGFVLDRPSQLKLEGQRTSQGIFAPAISYNPHNQTYYMVTTNVGVGNFFVKTKDPFGSWSDPIMLPEVHGIDPSFFFDNDGRAYIVNNDEPAGPAKYDGHRAIRVREFDVATDKVIGPEKILLDGGVRPEEKPIWIEGPHIYNINGKYYLMAAEGGTSVMHSEVILRGDSPMGKFIPWEKNPILTQRHMDPKRPNPVTCAGHADLIQDEKGDWWSVFLACRPIDGEFENLGRETFLMPVKWSEDGFPYMTQGDDLIPMIIRKEGLKRDETNASGNFDSRDDFNTTKLSMDWFTLRTPADSLYSLTEKPGFLTLNYANTTASETGIPAFVARRLQHHEFEVETRLSVPSTNPSDAAGLLLYKDETHQYFLAVRPLAKKQVKISLEKISESGSEILSEAEVKYKKSIDLKIISKGRTIDFQYSSNNEDWKTLIEGVDAFFLSTANSFGFTGTTIGPYATAK